MIYHGQAITHDWDDSKHAAKHWITRWQPHENWPKVKEPQNLRSKQRKGILGPKNGLRGGKFVDSQLVQVRHTIVLELHIYVHSRVHIVRASVFKFQVLKRVAKNSYNFLWVKITFFIY